MALKITAFFCLLIAVLGVNMKVFSSSPQEDADDFAERSYKNFPGSSMPAKEQREREQRKREQDRKRQAADTKSTFWGFIGSAYQVVQDDYYTMQADPLIEQKKFPDIMISDLLGKVDTPNLFAPLLKDDTPENIYKRAFPYTIGTKALSYHYDGYWFIKEIDYGNVNHTFLGYNENFSPIATYLSLRDEINPYAFVYALYENNVTCSSHKSDFFKGEYGKTYITVLLHTYPAGDKFIKVVMGRFRKNDTDFLKNFKTKAPV